MVDFLHYGIKRRPVAPVVAAKPAPKPAVKPEVKKEAAKPVVEEKKEEEMTAQVVMAESTAPVLQEEQIQIQEEDTVQEVVEKVKKSKKLHAKVEEGGKKVRVKRVLKETADE